MLSVDKSSERIWSIYEVQSECNLSYTLLCPGSKHIRSRCITVPFHTHHARQVFGIEIRMVSCAHLLCKLSSSLESAPIAMLHVQLQYVPRSLSWTAMFLNATKLSCFPHICRGNCGLLEPSSRKQVVNPVAPDFRAEILDLPGAAVPDLENEQCKTAPGVRGLVLWLYNRSAGYIDPHYPHLVRPPLRPAPHQSPYGKSERFSPPPFPSNTGVFKT